MIPASTPEVAVLVVEDEADLLATYRRLLGRVGLRVVTASTREGGLHTLGGERFAAVIVDVRLPDGDGLDVVRAARAMAPPLPTMVVTGFPSRHLRETALAAGATEFFAKPFDAATLAARVAALVRANTPA